MLIHKKYGDNPFFAMAGLLQFISNYFLILTRGQYEQYEQQSP
jgi:hypothetical protein